MNSLSEKTRWYVRTRILSFVDEVRLERIIVTAALMLGISVGSLTTVFMGLATTSYGIMVGGFLARTFRVLHARLMTVALTMDISLLLTIEAQRDAVKTAVGSALSAYQYAHIITSFAAVLLYIPLVLLGVGLFREKLGQKSRKVHIGLGISAFFLRTLGYLLMFSMLTSKI